MLFFVVVVVVVVLSEVRYIGGLQITHFFLFCLKSFLYFFLFL